MWPALFFWISTPAAAGPWLLPEGAETVYVGAGVGTFRTGMSGFTRDRQIQLRAAGFAAVGLPGQLEASVSVPVVASFVVEDPEQGPCPAVDYCATTVSVGTIAVGVRRQLFTSPLPVSVGLAVYGDPWNAGTRSRWTNVGQGIVGGGLTAATGVGGELGESALGLDLTAGWWPTFGREAVSQSGQTRRAPVGPATGSLAGWLRRGDWTVALATRGQQRLGGVPYGGEWVNEWRQTEDRWSINRYGELRAEAKLSWAFADGWGLHASVGRSLLVQAGPPDLWDGGLGVHRYWAPREDPP